MAYGRRARGVRGRGFVNVGMIEILTVDLCRYRA